MSKRIYVPRRTWTLKLLTHENSGLIVLISEQASSRPQAIEAIDGLFDSKKVLRHRRRRRRVGPFRHYQGPSLLKQLPGSDNASDEALNGVTDSGKPRTGEDPQHFQVMEVYDEDRNANLIKENRLRIAEHAQVHGVKGTRDLTIIQKKHANRSETTRKQDVVSSVQLLTTVADLSMLLGNTKACQRKMPQKKRLWGPTPPALAPPHFPRRGMFHGDDVWEDGCL